MTALFCAPLPIVAISGNQSIPLRPISNLSHNEPGLVWRSVGLTDVYFVVRVDQAFDTLALLGSNLRSTDTVRFRAGSSVENCVLSPSYDSGIVTAWSGTKSPLAAAKTVVNIMDPLAGQFVRIDISAPAHPDGHVQAQRLVIGKAILHEGIDQDSELGWIDQSPSYNGPNWLSFDRYTPLPTWKIKLSWVRDDDFRSTWAPFLQGVGISRPFIFVPVLEDKTRHQIEAVFGHLTTSVTPRHPGHDLWAIEMNMVSLAP